MTTMQSQWDGDLPLSSSEEEDRRMLGQILERSTSAPPMKSVAPGINFDGFGDDDDTVSNILSTVQGRSVPLLSANR